MYSAKVMREVKGFLPTSLDPENLEDLKPEEQAELQTAREMQQSCTRRFLCLEPGECCAKPKVYKVATFRLLQAIDNALYVLTGHGLEQFASLGTKVSFLTPEMQAQVADWVSGLVKSLSQVADQHSCGLTGCSFLVHAGWELLTELAFDPPHRFWNSEKLGLLEGDGWDAVLMTTIPYTINDGPWQGAGFFRQLKDAKDEYMALVGRTACPLLCHYLPSIAKDLHRESELDTAAFLDHVWGLLEDGTALRSKGPKPSLCRWYSWVDAHEHWRPWYHLRVVLFLYWAMGCGLLTRNTATKSFSLLPGPKAPEDVQKETMKEQASKLSRLRAKGKNMLHVSLLILMNPIVFRKANMVYEALQAMRLFHGHQVLL